MFLYIGLSLCFTCLHVFIYISADHFASLVCMSYISVYLFASLVFMFLHIYRPTYTTLCFTCLHVFTYISAYLYHFVLHLSAWCVFYISADHFASLVCMGFFIYRPTTLLHLSAWFFLYIGRPLCFTCLVCMSYIIYTSAYQLPLCFTCPHVLYRSINLISFKPATDFDSAAACSMLMYDVTLINMFVCVTLTPAHVRLT